jgi:beta-glucosidase
MIKAMLALGSLLFGGLMVSVGDARAEEQTALSAAQGDLVESLLLQMTLAEKVGQLTQAAGGRSKNLNSKLTPEEYDRVRAGGVGSYLHVAGAEPLRELQRAAVEESRLRIPLLFAMDVVHGYRTIFPVPLAIAASWEPEQWETTARISAREAASSGLHWTFAPMVDITRDPRWGRVVEGSGEDPYLGSIMAAAQVHGYQGQDLAAGDTVMATTKHFGAYGAPIGGRDYGSADISERSLHETYLPPFYAAMAAGTGGYMTAFNDIAGRPTTANADLINGTLRGTWGFDGMIVSDWNAIAELMNHGIARTRSDAGALAISAGIDMDMMSLVYADDLSAAVIRDPALLTHLDNAVRNVLKAKLKLGLFDNPFIYHDAAKEAVTLRAQDHLDAARQVAVRSIVMLKNDNAILPLGGKAKRIAVIGSLATDTQSQLGSWRARGDKAEVVSLLDGIKSGANKGAVVDYAAGIDPDNPNALQEAVALARNSDIIVLVTGEDYDLSGEARSRSDVSLPQEQQILTDAILAVDRPVIVALTGGRPLAIANIAEEADAVLMTWFLGNEAGPALADVIFGRAAPGGKLPISFPHTTGQVPYSHSEYPSGRPADPDPTKDTNRYSDLPITPLYPFGHGLSYGDIKISNLVLSAQTVDSSTPLTISITLINNGKVAGDETVQLYLRDRVASIAQPQKMLRGFKRLSIKPKEKRTVSFTLTSDQLAFYAPDGKWRSEAGAFDVMVGSSAENIVLTSEFELTETVESKVPASAIATKVAVK